MKKNKIRPTKQDSVKYEKRVKISNLVKYQTHQIPAAILQIDQARETFKALDAKKEMLCDRDERSVPKFIKACTEMDDAKKSWVKKYFTEVYETIFYNIQLSDDVPSVRYAFEKGAIIRNPRLMEVLLSYSFFDPIEFRLCGQSIVCMVSDPLGQIWFLHFPTCTFIHGDKASFYQPCGEFAHHLSAEVALKEFIRELRHLQDLSQYDNRYYIVLLPNKGYIYGADFDLFKQLDNFDFDNIIYVSPVE